MNNKVNSDEVLECYNCSNNMNYKHYICCDDKCYWCWNCSETQYMDVNGKLHAGHNPTCKEYDTYPQK